MTSQSDLVGPLSTCASTTDCLFHSVFNVSQRDRSRLAAHSRKLGSMFLLCLELFSLSNDSDDTELHTLHIHTALYLASIVHFHTLTQNCIFLMPD